MKYRVSKIFTFGVIVLLLFSVVAFSITPDKTWKKAVDLVGKNTNWVPGKMITKTYMIEDGKEELKSKVHFRLYEKKGEVEREVLKATKGGEDITEEFKKETKKKEKEKEKKSKNSISVTDVNPLNPEVQNKVEIKNRKTSKDNAVYKFLYKRSENPDVKGKVWIKTKNSVPVKLRYKLDPLPDKVKSMHNVIKYRFKDENHWYPEKMTGKGKAGFLFITKKFKTITDFRDYWKSEQEQGSSKDTE